MEGKEFYEIIKAEKHCQELEDKVVKAEKIAEPESEVKEKKTRRKAVSKSEKSDEEKTAPKARKARGKKDED